MKKIMLMMCVVIGLAGFVQAQSDDDDYKKTEFYAGYAFKPTKGRQHGVNGSGVYNFTRYIGVKGDVSATFTSDRYTTNSTFGLPYSATFRISQRLFNAVGGIQVKDNSNKGRFKPFAHAMIGAANAWNKTSDYQCTPTANCIPFVSGAASNWGLAAVLGGGVDIRLKKRLQLRLIQVDYNPIGTGFGNTNNMRLGAGIVF